MVDTGATHYPQAPKIIKVFDVVDSKSLRNGRTFTSMELPARARGLSDGIRADKDGNIWSAAGWVGEGYDGVHIFAPSGERIGMILLPEICANVCFGGPNATACSWPPASPFMPFTSIRRARTSRRRQKAEGRRRKHLS